MPSRFGSPCETLQAAKLAMQDKGITVCGESGTWLSAPVPVSDQPWYHNEVVCVETDSSPFQLLDILQDIENEFGRVRTVRNAARILDLDLIAYHNEILNKPELIVPHPRMHKRAFVLLPMRELIKDWEHPVLGVTLDDFIMNLPEGQEAVLMEGEYV